MSIFDADSFMQTNFTEENETKIVPCPAGEYAAKIERVDPKVTDSGKAMLNVTWEILDPNVLAATGRSKVTVRQTIWLDIDNGALQFGPGKNIGLGRLREACGQNVKGQPWQPAMLVGASAKVKTVLDPDKNDPSTIYDRVTAVAKL